MPQVEALIDELTSFGVPVVFHNGNAASEDERATALDALQAQMGPDDTVGVLLHSLAFGTLRPFFAEDGKVLAKRQLDMTLDVMAHSLVYWSQDLISRDLLAAGGSSP